jgi:Flagellar transcriptional activator (FlhC)
MRVSDDRYTKDRQRLDLALRLIRHEARTFTIRQWTGLSDDRIRKLYRSYVMNLDAQRVSRHRGKSPRQAAFFFRNAELNFHSTQLASLYVMYGLLSGTDSRLEPHFRVGSLESGTLLCQAYEAYLELHAPASISFEHGWFLLMALARRDEVTISRCSVCGGVRLRDLLAKHRLVCCTCDPAAASSAPGTTPEAVIGCAPPC